jgi:hypothetical protein
MKRRLVFFRPTCVLSAVAPRNKQRGRSSGIYAKALLFMFLAFAACLQLQPNALGQIQSTISCPANQGYWDVLSVMMMDPGLAAGYHMEGITDGLPSSYIYTMWDQSQNKVFYIKNPQGNPWDINLYDSNFVYQWITELQEWNGVNHWGDPTSCRKFNNASQNATADFSMRWAARCAVPGGANSSFWNPPPTVQPNNTNYYTYVDEQLQSLAQNLGYANLKIGQPGHLSIADHRATPPKWFSVTTLPLEYTYSCSVSQNVNSCQSREIFEYGVDTDVNPVDKVRHSYGWIRWRLFANTTGGNPDLSAVWVLKNTSNSNHLMAGQVNLNFQCF